MADVRAIISAINDDYKLKSRSTIKLLYDWMSSDNDGGFGSLVEYLDHIASDEDHPHWEMSTRLLNRLNEVDFTKYLDYIEEMDSYGIKFVPFYSILYPRALWKIDNPPLCLYVNGETSGLFGGIAIVGTREAHEERKEFAKELASILAKEGYPIISGLANGIDTMAHEGAIEGGGQTIAVLPGDVQSIRPSSNKDLAKKIPENGALVAELSEYEDIHRGRFVERNRITSGISIAVVVGASGETGGTVRQAEFARDQGRPRFVYDPGTDDGQSPEKIAHLGFKRFSSIQELDTLLNSEWDERRGQEPIADYLGSAEASGRSDL